MYGNKAADFKDRSIIIGYKGHALEPFNSARTESAFSIVGDFYFHFEVFIRPKIGDIFRQCYLCDDGTVTLLDFREVVDCAALIKATPPYYFFCPAQWKHVSDKTHPVPAKIWDVAVELANYVLLEHLVSLEAHRMHWIAQSNKPPRERDCLNTTEVLAKYGKTAKTILARNREIGFTRWSKEDCCGEFFDDCTP